ncbi:MAG: glycosyltransferase family 1 protein [bacterium]|nr:glycosyltransferase family 1 protein [bacterium]
MKIAIDIRTAGGEKAGKGWYTFHIVQNLLRLDRDNEYILYAKEGIAGFQQFKNARLKLIHGKGLFWHNKVISDVKREGVDIFFAPSSYITPALLPHHIKTIVTVHDLVAFLFPNRHNKKAVILEKLFLKRALKRADHIITVSQNTKKDILNKFKYERDKIDTVYCSAGDDFKPVEKDSLTSFIAKTNLPKNFFLAVGTLEPRKNYTNLIKAFAKFREKHPSYHLIIVGKEGWEFQDIYDEIRENQITKKVHILGYLSGKSLVGLYNLAKGLVFPSLYEGFGIPPLEAMKSGCPVIASYSSSIPEVVGDSALLINPENPIEIANAMLKLANSEELCEKLRNKGLAQSRKFSWENSAKKLLEILEQL